MRITRLHGTLGPRIIAIHVSTLDDYSETVALWVPLHSGGDLGKSVVSHSVCRVLNIPNSDSAISAVRSQSILCSSVPLAGHNFLCMPTQFCVRFLNMFCDASFWNNPQLSETIFSSGGK